MDLSIREVLDRYGPTLALISVVVLLVLLFPSNVHGGSSALSSSRSVGEAFTGGSAQGTPNATGPATRATAGVTGPGAGTTVGASGVAGVASNGSVSGQLASSAAGGTTVGSARTFKCRADGRQFGISSYMPPCVASWNGLNGGATARGVTPTAIKIAYFVPQFNAATQAALKSAGFADDQATIDRSMEVLRRYFNNFYLTWGREVQFTKVNASGASSDDVAAKADAHAIAAAGYFAVITANGTTMSPTFDATLAQLGVICLACTVSEANSFYQRTKGYNFGALPTAREYYENVGEYWGKRLAGKKAAYAQTPNLSGSVRKFGLIWANANMGTVDPGAQEERDNFVNNILPQWGIHGIVDESYNYDVSQGPTEAQTIIAKMHADNVTTIGMVADPVFPIFFTKEATKEAYLPEWFITGTELSDTTFFDRTYDQTAWKNAFGISPLQVFWQNLQYSDGYREYHEACPYTSPTNPNNCTPGTEATGINTQANNLLQLFTGIQMAGPDLTPRTFAQGQYNYPATGGTPAYALFKFSADSPVLINDMTEVWWNASGTGLDETGHDGAGILMKADQGKRYQLGHWPAAQPYVQSHDPSPVFTSNAPYGGTGNPPGDPAHSPSEKCLSC